MNVDEISAVEVRRVLRFLARDRTPRSTPLTGLELVRRSLEEAGFQATEQARQYEIGRLLTEIAEHEVQALRRRILSGPALADPLEALRADFGHGCRELESWSAVYHLYLRPDLDLRPITLAVWLDDRHQRTMQRRLRRGVEALTQRLQRLERQARLDDQAAQVAARVPVAPERRLVGVAKLVDHCRVLLRSADGAPVLALRGPGGIGKTALAAAVGRAALTGGDFRDLAWVTVSGRGNGSGLPAAVVAAIAQQVAAGGGDSPACLRGRFRRRPILLVLDGLDEPEQVPAALAALELIGGPSRALVTGRLGMAGLDGLAVEQMPALSGHDALGLLRRESAERGLRDIARAPDPELEALVGATAGHPLAIRLAAAQLRAGDLAEVTEVVVSGRGAMAALCRDMWQAAWSRAGPAAQAAVKAAARHREPQGHESLGAALSLGGQDLSTGLAEAMDLGLLEHDTSGAQRRYHPALFLRRFLRCGDLETV